MAMQEIIPIFPLGSTLFPMGLLPLKIFEVRYLDMINQCVKNDTGFGVVTIETGSEVRRPEEKVAIYEHGTLATLAQFDVIKPNLYMILAEGTKRFKVLHKEQQANGLWIANVEYLEPDPVTPIPPELNLSVEILKDLIEVHEDQAGSVPPLPFNPPYQFENCAWVANRWAELLPLTPGQRQHLLSMENPRLRLDLVSELLEEMGIAQSRPNQ